MKRPSPSPRSDDRLTFLKGFLSLPAQVGSIVPSSRYVERRIVERARIREVTRIVELGPGTGGTTRAILGAMREDARLLAIEINPRFHRIVESIEEPRLVCHLGSAEDIAEIAAAHGFGQVDAVISGIPFSAIKPDTGRRIIGAISELLSEGGRFVAYQVTDRVNVLGRAVLGPSQVDIELLNIPPVRVYSWTRTLS